MERVEELMKKVAAEVVTPSFRALSSDQIFEKGPGDLVTVADREVERRLTTGLQQLFPKCVVVGEEATAADPGLLDHLDEPAQLFVVDPIDGTKNYVHGRDDHALMIGEVHHGETVRAWIFQPQHDRMYTAERGAGVACNGERLAILDRDPDPATWVGVSTRKPLLDRPGDARLGAMSMAAWCCGVDYPRIVTGENDYLMFRKMMPWDHIPGCLMVNEIGGVTRTLDGRDYRVGVTGSALLAAATPEIWAQVNEVLFTGPDAIEM